MKKLIDNLDSMIHQKQEEARSLVRAYIYNALQEYGVDGSYFTNEIYPICLLYIIETSFHSFSTTSDSKQKKLNKTNDINSTKIKKSYIDVPKSLFPDIPQCDILEPDISASVSPFIPHGNIKNFFHYMINMPQR